ncbi:MAG: four helix bundle protein, partial [Eubacterium sp.]|nr:four helix bundle protein [Eubacterium sp.]
AEGKQRATAKDYSRFLSIAKGSAAELETQLLICVRLKFLKDDQIDYSLKLCDEIQKMLNVLSDKISSNDST